MLPFSCPCLSKRNLICVFSNNRNRFLLYFGRINPRSKIAFSNDSLNLLYKPNSYVFFKIAFKVH
jgi:hypothetical protein